MPTPQFHELFNPLLQVLRKLGGSASITEMEVEVALVLRLNDEEINKVHKGNRTEFGYRLAWARYYLKRYGVITNSSRGVWVLTEKGKKIDQVDVREVLHYVREVSSETPSIREEVEEGKGPEEVKELWEDELLEEIKNIKPDAFERLCQRILREAGFVSVEITGRSGDGGIDGKGIMKLGGFLSFHIIFQCKRYAGSVSAQEIRDFRGAMVGRADKGLFMTTGTFTRDARQEAIRDGAPPIDLVDGDELVEKIKEFGLGVRVKTEESVEIDKEWFGSL